jgi:hypothetical protein
MLGVSEIGPISARKGTVAVLGRREGGKPYLHLWEQKQGKLGRWEVPPGFAASLSMPPVISTSGHVVVLVNHEASYFLGFDVQSRRWLMPVVVDRRHSGDGRPSGVRGPWWEWSEIGTADLAHQKWHAGSGLGTTSDRLLVDPGSSLLWVAIINSPAGATPTGGRLGVIMTHDELVPLDLDNGQAMAFSRGTTGVAPLVWPNYLRAVSSDDERTNIAVLYHHGEKVDCVLYTWQGSQWKQEVLATDLPAEPPMVSLSPAGDRVAFGRVEDSRARVEVLDARSKRVLLTWP